MTGEKKLPLISLSEMVAPPSFRGVGLHNLHARNLAFGGKLVWKVFSQPNIKWCRLMQEKYLDNLDTSRILQVLDPPKGSTIWNFIIKSHHITTSSISWEVHDDESVDFWLDSWNSLPPLSSIHPFLQIWEIACSHWGSKLVNYVSAISMFSGLVLWHDFSLLPIDPQSASDTNSFLAKQSIFLSPSPDKLFWCPSPDGNYSVKLGYDLVNSILLSMSK